MGVTTIKHATKQIRKPFNGDVKAIAEKWIDAIIKKEVRILSVSDLIDESDNEYYQYRKEIEVEVAAGEGM